MTLKRGKVVNWLMSLEDGESLISGGAQFRGLQFHAQSFSFSVFLPALLSLADRWILSSCGFPRFNRNGSHNLSHHIFEHPKKTLPAALLESEKSFPILPANFIFHWLILGDLPSLN
jgi:hypothetical protein